MMLPDRIQLVGKVEPRVPLGDPIPAHVGAAASGSFQDSSWVGGGRFATVTAVAVIAPGSIYDPALHDVQWRGETWTHDGAPAYVRRHGRDHHTTIPLKRVVSG